MYSWVLVALTDKILEQAHEVLVVSSKSNCDSLIFLLFFRSLLFENVC